MDVFCLDPKRVHVLNYHTRFLQVDITFPLFPMVNIKRQLQIQDEDDQVTKSPRQMQKSGLADKHSTGSQNSGLQYYYS